jgi:DNA (cytosine-5)-methyltransferase 1
VPCPLFSKAGKQLGDQDERVLFPEAIRLVSECKPQAVMLENVSGLLDPVFDEYGAKITSDLKNLISSDIEQKAKNINLGSKFSLPVLPNEAVFHNSRKITSRQFPKTTPKQVSNLMATLENVPVPPIDCPGYENPSPWKREADVFDRIAD